MRGIHLALGVDIGGTNTSLGLVDRRGSIINLRSVLTCSRDRAEDFVDGLHRQIEAICAEVTFPHRLVGIGIGAPNAHSRRKTIEHPVNLNWGETIQLVSLLRQYYDLPIELTNDAKAAAAGEMLFGGARGMKDFMVVTLGTGLGCGIVADGRLLDGASGFAGELGHMTVDPEGRECRCGKRGCLETYASASGLVRTAVSLLASQCHPSPLRETAVDKITSEQIAAMAAAGDAIALEALEVTARILGMKLADAVACVSPEAIFLTGGLARCGDLLMTPVEKHLNGYLFRAYRGTVQIRSSMLAPGAGAVQGAAALMWRTLTHEGGACDCGKERDR